MDSVCADNQTTPNSLDHNNTTVAAMEPAQSTQQPPSDAVVNNAEPQTQTYDVLFPSLPSGSGPGSASGSGSGPIGDSLWSKKPMLMSSTVTQVFHIPVEERKDQVFFHFSYQKILCRFKLKANFSKKPAKNFPAKDPRTRIFNNP